MTTIRIACSGELIPLNELKPIQGDLKTLTKENFEKLTKAIEQDGWSYAIHYWVNKENEKCILDGTQRHRVATKNVSDGKWALDKVPCVKVEAETFEAALKTLLHGASSYGSPDSQGYYELAETAGLTVEDLKEVALSGIDQEKHEAEYYEDEATREGEDDVPEPPKEAKTKRGELWILGQHRLLIDDCTVKENVERLMAGEKADMVFTSPPYLDLRDYGGGLDLSTKTLSRIFDWPSRYFIVNLGLIVRDRKMLRYWDEWISEAESRSLPLLSWNVWDKGNASSVGHQQAMFGVSHEWIFVFGDYRELNKTKKNKLAGGGSWSEVSQRQKDGSLVRKEAVEVSDFRQLDTVFQLQSLRNFSEDYEGHPAAFPSEFPYEFIQACTKENVIVADPFLGSGSTLIACEKTNRRCFGMEIEPLYGDVIISRWEKFSGKTAHREDGVTFGQLSPISP